MLKDKVVIITGAGSGLGRDMAHAFCAKGAKVIGFGRSMDKLTETKESIKEGFFEAYSVDISDFQQVTTATEQILDKHGRIDILFNNAAVYPKINFLEESADAFAQAVAINVNGAAYTCKAVLPTMLKQNYGRVFNLGSWADLGPIPDSVAYSATKGAMHALTKAIAADIAQHDKDVEVHEWIPGHLNTQMSEFTGMDPAIAAAWAVEIVEKQHGSKKNCIYEQNREWQPPKSLKQRLKAKLMFWK